MAPDGGRTGEEVSTVITCEGTLGHPEFSRQFQIVVDRLNGLLGVPVKVRKLEPWNSVRVTLSVPREAALRLRQLAQQGAPQLRALGILSVQLDGEGAISLRLQGANGEPQEVILRTTQDGSSSSGSGAVPLSLGSLLPNVSGTPGGSAAGAGSQVQFKSPNVVCPSDSVVPRVGANMGPPQGTIPTNSINKPPYAGPFPFASMNQAIHSQSNNANGSVNVSRSTNMDPPPPPFLPPPYPGIRQSPSASVVQAHQPAVTISSPLLVNLLQNDQQGTTTSVANSNNSKTVRHMRAPPSLPPGSTAKATGILAPPSPVSQPPSTTVPSVQPQSQGSSNHLITSQANVLVNSSNNNLSNSSVSSNPSPSSALSTSIASTSTSVSLSNVDTSSAVTSTQLAIHSIANSLATAANNLSATSNSSGGSVNQQTGIFGINVAAKGPFAQPGPGHRYQRTPQGSIIAVNKPLSVQNQGVSPTVSANIPVNQASRTNLPLVQVQSAQAILRQHQQVVTQKNTPMFGHNNVVPQAGLIHQNQAKVLHSNTNNLLSSGNNNVTVKNHSLTHANIAGIIGSRNGQSGVVAQQNNQVALGLAQPDSLVTQVVSAEPAVTNVVKKPLPSPPPYSVAITRTWESLMSNAATNLLDLAPALTDLKPDELDELLPTLDQDALPELSELELLGSALNANSEPSSGLSSDDHTKSNHVEDSGDSTTCGSTNSAVHNSETDSRKFLINPLTGELEPHSAGEESDVEEVKDVFTGLPSPLGLSDEDTNSTSRLDTTTDQSDSETRSSTEGKHSRVKNSKIRREGRDSPAQKEKIKLRLKLEKNEPINPAYKVDVSFVNAQQPKKATTSVIATPSSLAASGSEELRVPPLHISLRGRNSAVIKNKTRLNPDGTPVVKKTRKLQNKARKEGGSDQEGGTESGEHRRLKKMKANHEHKELLASLSDMPGSPGNNSISKYSLHNHYKEKQKERRGSDSELVRGVSAKKHDANGILVSDDKRRRLSQSESDKRLEDDEDLAPPSILGSTNVGTVAVIPQKIRKDKIKLKESFKMKDSSNRKLFATSKAGLGMGIPASPPDRRQQAVTLPTAIDLDMEAKFKQSLMEGAIGEKGIPRPPHRTVEVVGHMQIDTVKSGSIGERVPKSPSEMNQVIDRKEKSPEPEKCNVPDNRSRKSLDGLQEREKQLNNVVTSGGRSPNSGSSGGQGEDSGIESMDALSEKSPNQASQSPHADILPNVVVPTSKTQVPDILDIEAQLAKMEGLEPHQEEPKNDSTIIQSEPRSPDRTTDDVNENECIHRSDSKPCCDLTCTLQDDLDKNASKSPTGKDKLEIMKEVKKEELQTPISPTLCVAPALYSYPSNPVDKGGGGGGGGVGDQDSRGGSESPMLTTEDEDSNMTPLSIGPHVQQQQTNNKNKSLLEQLLIEIPSESTPNLHSPATRSSVRTRALSKLNSPELSSPVPKLAKAALPTTTAKRKRNESDSSNHSMEELRKRPRKGSEGSEVGKRLQNTSTLKKTGKMSSNAQNQQQQQQDESSDSDEPLIEKLRKTVPKGNVKMSKGGAAAGPQATPASQVNNKTNIRRSARAGQQQEKQQPAQNTRSREKGVQQQQTIGHHQVPQVQQIAQNTNAEAEAAALRRKTRSADMDSKRKKEVK